VCTARRHETVKVCTAREQKMRAFDTVAVLLILWATTAAAHASTEPDPCTAKRHTVLGNVASRSPSAPGGNKCDRHEINDGEIN
jgi:hypothetical protein